MRENSMKETIISLLEHKFKFDVVQDRVRFNNSVVARLVDAGYRVQKEVSIPFLDSAIRVNYMVCSQDGELCVIELDNRSPRSRSLDKIYSLSSQFDGFVLLRNGSTTIRHKNCGVDVVTAGRR